MSKGIHFNILNGHEMFLDVYAMQWRDIKIFDTKHSSRDTCVCNILLCYSICIHLPEQFFSNDPFLYISYSCSCSHSYAYSSCSSSSG